MAGFFPRATTVLRAQDLPALRRLSMSLVEMAVVTGVLLRAYRALVLTHGTEDSWLYIGGTVAVGLVFLFGMATMHLGNYTLRRWTWRAPVFGFVEGATEALMSMALIALGREPLGSGSADFADWPSIAERLLLTHTLAVALFALVLAAVVQTVRLLIVRREATADVSAEVGSVRSRR